MEEDSCDRSPSRSPYPVRHDEIPAEARLQSEIAGLRYKNERFSNELRDCEAKLKMKENSLQHVNNEIDSHKENLARLSAINNSLQKKLQDVEDRERTAVISIARFEGDIQKAKQDNRHYQERIVELESQFRSVLIDRESSDQSKECAQRNLAEFSRKIASAIDYHDDVGKTEIILKRIFEINQENSRLKMKLGSLKQTLESYENGNKANGDLISRLSGEKESLNQQIVSYLTSIDSLKREKEQLISEKSYLNTELQSFKDKSQVASRTVCNLNEQNKNLDIQMITSKENLLIAEDKNARLEKEVKNFQESVAIQLSTGNRMVESTAVGIRERIKDIQVEIKEKQFGNDQLREKVGRMSETIERLERLLNDSKNKEEDAIGEKVSYSKRLLESDTQLSTLEILNEGLRKDKNRFMKFLEQLGNTMGLDEVSKELGFDLQTDAILARSEQLARLEGDRLADKTATVYQLQRRVRTLKDQLEKKDLHLDMLRKKIMVLEESVKLRTTLEQERDHATARASRLSKHLERIELDLREAKVSNKDVRSQLADAAEYKILALERARKIEELENRVNDLELLRLKYNRKVGYLKDHLKTSRENTNQERDLNDHAFQQLSNELNSTKRQLLEATRRESQLLNLRSMVGRILGIDWTKTVVPDYELISKLEKIVQTNREFAQVSRKLNDSIKQMPHQTNSSTTPSPRDRDRDKDESLDDLLESESNRRNI